jgi:hypothetical protein
MRIQVENARKEEGTQFPFSFVQPASQLGNVEDMPWHDSDIAVSGSYWFDGVHLRVEGTVGTTGVYTCGRCLTPVEIERKEALSEVYGTEAELPDDVSPYNGEYIDLTETVRELLILSEPMKVLCRSDCAGLCPECGVNLNEGACSCRIGGTDPRLAILGDLLNREH